MIRPRFGLPQFVLVLSYAFLLSVRECRAFATLFVFLPRLSTTFILLAISAI